MTHNPTRATGPVTVGVVGLGRMGGNMARRLLDAGHQVTGYDTHAPAQDALETAGGQPADSPAAAAVTADLVLTSLPDPPTVETVYLGDDGLLTTPADGLICLETSTIDPDTTERIATAATDHGARLIDAPVSGGPEAARDGTLTMLIGATEPDLADTPAADILPTLATTTHYLGQLGGGHAAKLVNNVMSMGNLLLAMEAMTLAAARGLDPVRVYEAVRTAGGSSNQFQKRAPRVLNRDFEPGFTLEFSRKDLALAIRTAEDADYPMPVTSLITQLYTAGIAAGYGDEDSAAIVKLYEEFAQATVEAEEPVDDTFTGY